MKEKASQDKRFFTRKKMLLLIVVGMIFVLYVGQEIWLATRPKTFSPELWADVRNRSWMAEDLLERELLIGMTVDEAMELLGDSYMIFNDNEMKYYMGSNIFLYSFVFYANLEEGVVVECRINWFED